MEHPEGAPAALGGLRRESPGRERKEIGREAARFGECQPRAASGLARARRLGAVGDRLPAAGTSSASVQRAFRSG